MLKKQTDPDTRSQTIYQVIRDRICLLIYPPGMALREEALASEFGVSRTPIRRILQRLEFEGLVDINRGTGAVVSTVDLISLKEVYALRLKLASFMGEFMSPRVSDEDLSALADLIDKIKAMRDHYDLHEMGRLYNAFHTLMTGMIRNKSLRQITNLLFHQTERVWLQILPELDFNEEVDIACQEMSDVLAALRVGDMDTVSEIRREHMVMLLQRMNDYLSSARF
jgi:DNA-binding GntR family transcriptional regulator